MTPEPPPPHPSEQQEPTELKAPQFIGPYRVIGRLGAGGMGEVFLAHDSRLGRNVAIKILPPELTGDSARIQRLAQEARAASALNHPNIITIHELGEVGNTHYIVQEHVEGETLRRRMSRAPLSVDETLDVARQVASALSAAHAAGVVHRDIKPENIMLRQDGLVKVLDFGLAKLIDRSAMAQVETATGTIMGTSHYMSPEQTRGDEVDARTDVWSVGVMLYEMLAHRRPFDGPTASDTLSLILQREPERLTGVPAAIARTVSKALAKERDRRHANGQELLKDLQSGRSEKRSWIRVIGAIAAVLRSDKPQTVAPPAPSPQLNSIAVLPFTNLSGSPENEYLSDGITDEIISTLGRVPNLKVVSRTSVFALKGKSDDVRDVARKLGVSGVVEGSVRRAENRLRVTAQLIDARDGYQVWSQTFDRELTDVFAIQDQIAAGVAEALRVRLGGPIRPAPLTRNMEAYEAYLKGRQASNIWTRESLDNAVSLLRLAIELDPSFSQAWAGLAETYSVMDHRPGATTLLSNETYQLAEEAARRALELDPSSAEAHTALGHIYTHEGRFEEAERHGRRALELNPNSGMAHVWYATLMRTLRRVPEARRHFERGREVDPYSERIAYLGANLWLYGDFDGGLDFALRGLKVAPDSGELHVQTVRIHALQGRFAEAEAALKKAAAVAKPAPMVEEERALVRALEGRRTEGIVLLKRIEKEKRNPYRLTMMRAWAATGEIDRAVETLNRYVLVTPGLARVNLDLPNHPAFNAFLADPRYRKTRRDLGLPP